MQVVPRVAIERMRHEDIPTVQAIEREIFLSPWPRNAYATELAQNRQASPPSGCAVATRARDTARP